MAHLTDMEELLAEIESADIQDYMREAMTCYMSSAYRGCIVLSHIALFDGLLARLEELGKVHSDAKTIYKNAQEKKDDQDVFETYLIDQLYSKKLIAKLDADFLNILRNLRNKSAHPSGHKPSAEEARYIFFEVINRFLGQPLLETTGLVNKIIEELNNKNYFPTKKFADIEEAVKEAIAILAPEAYPQLIEKLLGKYTFKDKTIAQNANFFLNGLARLENEALTEELLTRVITAKLSDTNYSCLILCLVTSSDGKLFKNLSAIETNRFKKILQEKIASLDSIVMNSCYTSQTVCKQIQQTFYA